MHALLFEYYNEAGDFIKNDERDYDVQSIKELCIGKSQTASILKSKLTLLVFLGQKSTEPSHWTWESE
jgi:hypothetical protein